MATIIWKDGESVRCPAHRLQRNLDAGWSVTKEEPKKKAKKVDTAQLELSDEAEQSN